MRYTITPPTAAVLDWLCENGSPARVVPSFSNKTGLVVAHLVAGKVVAEVVPNPGAFSSACGSGIPLGRLYFQVPRELLYSVCSNLKPNSFEGHTI